MSIELTDEEATTVKIVLEDKIRNLAPLIVEGAATRLYYLPRVEEMQAVADKLSPPRKEHSREECVFLDDDCAASCANCWLSEES